MRTATHHPPRHRWHLATILTAAMLCTLLIPVAPAAFAAETCAVGEVCEAELGTLHGSAGIATNHGGYTGTGFVDGISGEAGVIFSVDAPTAGLHQVLIRYANSEGGDGQNTTRTLTLTVNDTTDVPVQLPVTGSWSTWSTVTVPVDLPQGTSELDLHVGEGDDGHVNIDSIVVVADDDGDLVEQGVTLRVFDVGIDLQEICTIEAGQTPNVDVLRPVINWSSAEDWGGYTVNYVAHVVADIDIAEAGTHTFRLESDDGSRLYIDGEEIIDHDGLHARTAKDGDVTLTAGSHDLRIEYFQAGGGAELTLLWRQPGETTFEVVPNSVLTTEGGGARVVSPGIKECEGLSGAGDGRPLTSVHPSFDLSDLRPDEGFQPDVSGMAWYPNGDIAVLTWGAEQVSTKGKLYRVTNVQGAVDLDSVEYTKIAEGLQEPQGVQIVDGEVYISSKVGLEKLVDGDGDGFFEGRDRIATWPNGDNFHEFAFGLPYRDGYFYVALSVALERSGASTVPQPGPDRGTVLKIDKDTGEIEYIAGGLRTPNGLGWGPGGSLLITDNQGGWVPTSKLVQVQEGAFYNHYTTFEDPVTGELLSGRFDHQPVTPPVLWMPHGEISNSPSTPVVMPEGPFAGQLAIGDVTYGGLQRAYLEEVDGQLQGALYRMTQGLEAGVNEVAVGPDGDLYIGGIGYSGNWGQAGKLRYGFQKLSANDTATMDILKTEITETGFDLTYTKPLSEETQQDLASRYQVQQWRYNATSNYGGPKLDEETLAVQNATVSEDGRTVSLDISGVEPGRVVHIHSPRPFTAADGEELWSTEVWYTANAVPGYEPPADVGYYEAEEALLSGGAGIANEHSGYSGSGFVDGFGSEGATVTFTANVEEAGTHPVHLRYANGPHPFEGTKTVSLYVNGTEVDPLELPSTGDWKTWAFVTRQLELDAGANTISITYEAGDDGNVNFDVLRVGEGTDICTPQAAEQGYTSLFDGTLESFSAWQLAGSGSFGRQADCTLRTEGGMGLLWYPEQEFQSYSLKLDWKLVKDDNSGIFVGFPDPGNDPWVAVNQGYEIQIDATDAADRTTGAIYTFQGADPEAVAAALNPVGSWNAYEIQVDGDNIRVFLNGTLVNDFTSTDPARDLSSGFIGIQNHGGGETVYFRNIRIDDDLAPVGPAPTLDVTGPEHGAVVDGGTVTVTGTTDGAEVEIRVGSTTVEAIPSEGSFSAEVPLEMGSNRIIVSAYSEAGVRASESVIVISRAFGSLVGGFEDPTGDDDGPGTYTYPTSSDFAPGSFDLTRMEVYEEGDSVRFVTQIAGEIRNPWGGDHISYQRVNVYLAPGEGDAVAALPGTNMDTASPWSAAVVIDGRFDTAGVYAPDGTKIAEGSLFTVPQTREIGITVPRSAFGDLDLTRARYGTAMFVNGEAGEGIGFVRPVYDFDYWNAGDPWWIKEWRMGGGAGVWTDDASHDSDHRDPNAMDVIVGPGQTQAAVLDWQAASPTVLPMLLLPGADITAPTTTAATDPDGPDGDNGWFTSPVSVTLKASDDLSSVVSTEYRIGDGDWATYDGPFTLADDGEHVVGYRSTDAAGNVEDASALTVKLDRTAPAVAVDGLSDGGSYGDSQEVTVSWSASDVTSGVGSTSATLDGEPVDSGDTLSLWELSLGEHQLVVTSTDLAGNEAVETVTFSTTTSVEDLVALVTRYAGDGRLDDRTRDAQQRLLATLGRAASFAADGRPDLAARQMDVFLLFVGNPRNVVTDDEVRALLARDATAVRDAYLSS